MNRRSILHLFAMTALGLVVTREFMAARMQSIIV